MTKKPDDPHRPHPDDQEHPQQPAPPADQDDSAIDFSDPGEGELSGISVIEWASLTEEPQPTGSPPGGLAAASDADLLAQLSNQPADWQPPPDPPPTPESGLAELLAEGESLFDVKPSIPGDRPLSSSAVDLANAARIPNEEDEEPIVAEVLDSGISLGDSGPLPPQPTMQIEDEIIDLDAQSKSLPQEPIIVDSGDAIDLGAAVVVVEEPVSDVSGGEAIDLGSEALVFEDDSAPESAAIELDAAAVIDDPSAGSQVSDAEAIDLTDDALIEESILGGSGIDLSAAAVASTSTGSDSEIDMMADDLLLERPDESPSGPGSGRDLIAEGLESGIDLLGNKNKSKKAKSDDDADAIEDDFLAQVTSGDPTSTVDLGSYHQIDVFEGASKDSTKRPSRSDVSDIDLEDLTGSAEEADELDLESIEESPAASQEEDIDLDLSSEQERPVEKASAKSAKKKPADEEELELEEEAPKPAKKSAKKGKKDEEADTGEEPVKGARKEGKQRGRAGAWVGGTLVGTLVGVGACVAVWFAGLVPDSGPPPRPTGSGSNVPVVPQPVVTFAPAMAKIKSGEFDAVTPEELGKADENKPEEALARAEYLWYSYLRNERGKDPRAPLRADAEPVKNALTLLDKLIATNNADALFLRGQIHEMTGKPAGATKDYQDGLQKFAANPADKARFETALQVMELTRNVSRLSGPARTAVAQLKMDPRTLALMLFILQQPPMGNPPTGQTPPTTPQLPEEAGHRFWQALAAAGKKDYTAALKAIDDARDRHDRRRYLLLRKQQNPTSDPREEIFLRCCAELRNYWILLGQLNNPSYLTADPKDRIKQVDALITKAEDNARSELLKDVGEKLVKGKAVAKVEDLVKHIDEERKTAMTLATNLQKKIDGQTKEIANQKKDISDLNDKLKTTETQLTKTADAEKQAKRMATDALALLKNVGEAVGSDFTDLKTSRESLIEDVKQTARMAKLVDPKGTLRQLERDLAADRAKLAERWTPAQMLAFWVPILQKDRDRFDLATKASEDAKKVLDDSTAKPEVKGQALLVQGLVLRNQDKFTEAQAELKKAQSALTGSKGPWLSVCEDALAETANPAATFAQSAEQLQAVGKTKEAMAVLDRGLKTVPDRKGPLYVQRARLAFEEARSKGALKPGDPLVMAAQKDAALAAKEGLAEGYYLSGRVAEELDRLPEAARHYREAIKLHGKLDEIGSRYRIALARVLLKQQPGEGIFPPPVPSGTRTSKAPSLKAMAWLLVLAFQPGLPMDKPTSSEAEKLADEVLALGDKAPFDARAQALAIKGLYTQALQVYTAGLREKGLLAPEHANTLLELINAHPVLRRPEARTTPDPLASEKHYASGLSYYFDRKYQEAEKKFISAVENDSNDARYYYFLGLSRLMQGKRDAQEDFYQGARLEQMGRPDRAAVSASLERVQGRVRRILNEARSRPTR